MQPTSPLLRRSSTRSGALALALLVALPGALFADGGSRHGGARRSPPPPPPQTGSDPFGRPPRAPLTSAPAPRQVPSSQAAPMTSGRSDLWAQRGLVRPGSNAPAPLTRPLTRPLTALPNGVRPIQRTNPVLQGASNAGQQRAPMPQVGQVPHVGAGSAPTWPTSGRQVRPLAGTTASPTWDSRHQAAPRVDAATRRGPTAPLDPRQGQLQRPLSDRGVSTYHSGGVRQVRTPGEPGSGLRGGVRSGAIVAPGAGASPALAAHVGGVHYGSHPSTTGRHGAYYGGHYGAGRGWGWARPIYPYAPYVEPVVVFNLWGFGGDCCCEPSPWVEPPLAYWPAEQPSYVPTYVPNYAPTYGAAPAAPAPVYLPPEGYPEDAATQAPSAPAWPAPNPEPAPSPEAGAPGQALESATEPGEPTGPEQEGQLTAEDEQALGASLEAFRRQAYEEALGLLEALVAKKPGLGHAWLGIAHAAFAAGNTQRAAQALTKAALLGGFPRGYRFDPATLYASPDAFRVAREALATQVAARPNDADAQLVSAWLLVSLGERAAAREQLDALLTLRPGDEAAPILAMALLPALPQPQSGLPNPARPQPNPALSQANPGAGQPAPQAGR